MSGDPGTHPGSGVVLTVRAEPEAAEALLEEFFTGRGWSVAERGPGRVSYEIGSRRRTVFLGALAGSAFHLTAPLELREGPGVTEIRYLWGDSAGRPAGPCPRRPHPRRDGRRPREEARGRRPSGAGAEELSQGSGARAHSTSIRRRFLA